MDQLLIDKFIRHQKLMAQIYEEQIIAMGHNAELESMKANDRNSGAQYTEEAYLAVANGLKLCAKNIEAIRASL